MALPMIAVFVFLAVIGHSEQKIERCVSPSGDRTGVTCIGGFWPVIVIPGIGVIAFVVISILACLGKLPKHRGYTHLHGRVGHGGIGPCGPCPPAGDMRIGAHDAHGHMHHTGHHTYHGTAAHNQHYIC